jgi:hypothetical protein
MLQACKANGVVVDLNVLRFYPVQLEGARIEDGNAELYLHFEVQQVLVFVDKQGELKQGNYDDLQKNYYGKCCWLLQLVF